MENKRPSVYEECRQKGISRRDFLKFCTTMAALMGLQASGVARDADGRRRRTGRGR